MVHAEIFQMRGSLVTRGVDQKWCYFFKIFMVLGSCFPWFKSSYTKWRKHIERPEYHRRLAFSAVSAATQVLWVVSLKWDRASVLRTWNVSASCHNHLPNQVPQNWARWVVKAHIDMLFNDSSTLSYARVLEPWWKNFYGMRNHGVPFLSLLSLLDEQRWGSKMGAPRAVNVLSSNFNLTYWIDKQSDTFYSLYISTKLLPLLQTSVF